MKFKVFITICLLAVFFNCCNQKKDLQSILSVDCYWDILDKGSPHPINSCYKFRKTGRCNYYYYNFFDKKRTDSVYQYDDFDVIVPNKWVMLSDSIISIRGIEYLILKYNSDSVFLRGVRKDSITLIKNCKTYNLHVVDDIP